MRKHIFKFTLNLSIFIGLIFLLNIPVTTRQGINYELSTIEMPLYLKMLDFFDRHYNYKQLAKGIVQDATTEKERMMDLFGWTYKNIKRVPEGMPVIDDHIWYTIIRGYGTSDQFQDIFTTLCNYANIDAFFTWLYPTDEQAQKPFSFVKLREGWSVFDVYNGVYFINAKGEIATVSDILKGNWQVFSLSSNPNLYDYYAAYFANLKSVDFQNWKLTRAAIQSPIRRLFFGNRNKKK